MLTECERRRREEKKGGEEEEKGKWNNGKLKKRRYGQKTKDRDRQ